MTMFFNMPQFAFLWELTQKLQMNESVSLAHHTAQQPRSEAMCDSAEVKFATEATGKKNKLNKSFPIAT